MKLTLAVLAISGFGMLALAQSTSEVKIHVDKITQWDNRMPRIASARKTTIVTIMDVTYTSCRYLAADSFQVAATEDSQEKSVLTITVAPGAC